MREPNLLGSALVQIRSREQRAQGLQAQHELLDLLLRLVEHRAELRFERRRVVREAVEAHPPASRENRTPRIYYATQVGVTPPTVVLFVNSTRLFDPTYQRYLLNVFRERLPFRDIPIKLYMRSRRQDEEAEDRSSTEIWEGPTGAIDEGQELAGSQIPGQSPRRGHLDIASRFLNREVNELLSDLDK